MKSLSHRLNGPGLPVRAQFLASQQAVTEERSRLSREIHDSLAQAFTSIILQADNLEFALGTGELQVKDALGRIQELARSGLDEARRAVRALRPKPLDGHSLSHALEQATNRTSTGSDFSCEFRQLGRSHPLPPEVEDELFRIAQEAMNNAREHARAHLVVVTLAYQPGGVILTIQDNGTGFTARDTSSRERGHGLTIMAERAKLIGSHLVLENAVSGGAVVRVQVPAPVTSPSSRLPRLAREL